MEKLSLIRDRFKPIQPSVKDENTISYTEFEPSVFLRNHIHCLWQLKTENTLVAPFNYRVVSDGCIDVFFDLNNTEDNFIMGFCKEFKEFPIGTKFNYVGIRFYPSIFPTLFKIAAKELSNSDIPLNHIEKDFSSFISNLQNNNLEKSISKIDDYLTSIIKNSETTIDMRFFNAFIVILEANGNIETESQLNTGLSPRQLRRMFNYYIGTTPKSFSLVVRFQHVLNKLINSKITNSGIFLDAGFYDQAHFIKNFSQFYGISPMKVFL
ncbi:DUF6597 domain-containing transcriptional factor [Tenacibaculum xiamenense]|uniref:DUF6597 domain-containing transcriptional factor n=1 Tax=Tenacibaculum xiamenense TaxID=1261553 RepID=UPI003895FF3B